ncbi:hypothetical protein [Paenibacillus naphthalenovorans]|uniref:hypothetical protein n=1 Tax=Paenibacillus naphthalenovorans TaxID=162209 RepID=UPI00088908BE|nr:hypothetical protein [Paenibacillus naphthalenovorans]SDJ76319.1 hypothetical protein SAMN05421868_14316 [Paenibacillus naphthalenovorans]
MGKKMQQFYSFIVVLMAVFVVWGLWNNYEKTKLNQRYERLIEEKEMINQKYGQLVDRIEQQVQLDAVRSETITQDIQDLQSRFRAYLDRLEDKAQ